MLELELRRIDPLFYTDHASLQPDDICYFLGEYTAHRGNSFSSVNQVIGDLKIKPHLAGEVELQSKDAAIRGVADAFCKAFAIDFDDLTLKSVTFVPIAPSAISGDTLYDDRIMKLLLTIGQGKDLDIRDLVKQRESVPPAHESEIRPSISQPSTALGTQVNRPSTQFSYGLLRRGVQ